MDSNTQKTNVEEETKFEMIDEFEGMDVEMLLPTMNVSSVDMTPNEKECIVKDDTLLNLYDELLDMGRKDRASIDEIMTNFLDMVLNDGDASSASKEAIVNLIKTKSDITDKMAKVADLMTRIKLRERDTMPKYLAAQQNNKVVIEGSKRDFLKSLNKAVNKKKGKPNDSQNQ